jgi:hypothetical protein
MGAGEGWLVPVVWCVDETQQLWQQCRDNPPDPAIVGALAAVLAHAAAVVGVVGVGGAPTSRTRCRPRGRRILLRCKEV